MASVFLDLRQGPDSRLDFNPFDDIASGSGSICAVGYTGIAFIRDTMHRIRSLRSTMVECRDDIILKRVWHVTVSVDIFYPCHCAFRHLGIPEREN